jgi:hypothetical protein
MSPPGPEPRTVEMSTPRSLASLRTIGETTVGARRGAEAIASWAAPAACAARAAACSAARARAGSGTGRAAEAAGPVAPARFGRRRRPAVPPAGVP